MLHITCRPKTWREVVGNKDTVAYLQSKVDDPNRPHAYLFAGASGCGKTTLARIFAQELGCEGSDFSEVDVAHYRGIDYIREIRQTMNLAPMMGTCRVWLMDEVQKMTGDAQNAFLKALEDTPAHVYFMLATTDPQKLIKPLLNRCTPCSITKLTDDELSRLILRTHKRTAGKNIDSEILSQICTFAEGTPRTALVLLEKHLSNPEAPIEAITADSKEIIDLCRALLKKQSWNVVKKVLAELKGKEPEDIRRAVLGYAAAVMLKADDAQALVILDVFKDPFYNSGWPGVVWACAVCVQK